MTRVLLFLHRALLLVVVTVALTATGFAHRMPSAQDGAQAEAIAFALANEAAPSDFCGGLPGSDRATALHCPACQIAASATLPQPSALLIDAQLAFHAQITAPCLTLALRSVRDPAHSPQAPPVA